jgi:hypothetical protein
MKNGDRVTVGDKDFTVTEAQEAREKLSPRVEVVTDHALLVPADEDRGGGDFPVQHDGEHLDNYNTRTEDWMFGPQDSDLDEEGK